jgi:hypothetical protein
MVNTQFSSLSRSIIIVTMGSAVSSISPERDLLDLHGRVAIVTGAKCVLTIVWEERAGWHDC